MRIASLALSLSVSVLVAMPARADLHITRDHGGLVEEYKAKYARMRERKERVVIDGICNSACTLLLGIVPLNRICVTPRASLGLHEAYIDKRWTAGIRVARYCSISIYPKGASSRTSKFPKRRESFSRKISRA